MVISENLLGLSRLFESQASMKNEDKAFYKKLYSVSTAGIFMVVATMIGYFMGHKLDQWFETYPWCTLFFLLCGVAAGFKNLFEIAVQESKEQ
jgi:ATP synthase protein I